MKANDSAALLDIGCRNHKAPNAIGIDLDAQFDVDVIALAEYLPFRQNTFRKALLSHVIEHCNGLMTMREIERVLVDGGEVYVETPNAYNFSVIYRFITQGVYAVSPDHVQTFGIIELNQLLRKAGLSTIAHGYKASDPRFGISKSKKGRALRIISIFIPQLNEHLWVKARKGNAKS